jgi:hypothetical protein
MQTVAKELAGRINLLTPGMTTCRLLAAKAPSKDNDGADGHIALKGVGRHLLAVDPECRNPVHECEQIESRS